MRTRWMCWRGAVVSCLAVGLLAVNLGCNAANNTGAASSTNKTPGQNPDSSKSKPGGLPEKDPG